MEEYCPAPFSMGNVLSAPFRTSCCFPLTSLPVASESLPAVVGAQLSFPEQNRKSMTSTIDHNIGQPNKDPLIGLLFQYATTQNYQGE